MNIISHVSHHPMVINVTTYIKLGDFFLRTTLHKSVCPHAFFVNMRNNNLSIRQKIYDPTKEIFKAT